MKRKVEFSSSEEDGSEDENAYSRAFKKIVGVPLPSAAESMGPVLAARDKLVAKKLQEQADQTEKKKSSSVKEEKTHGHVLPEPHLNSKEMALIKLATKGVVTLFNAVNKAQRIQAGSDSLKTSESKAVVKQSKAAFLTEIKKAKTQDEAQNQTSDEKPGWSVLQDDFMLGRPKLKDWDKQEDVSASEENDSDSDDD